MAVQRGTHPSADVLKAFALGKLNDISSDVVMTHLDQCPECRREAAALSGDDFLNRLRRARGRSSTSTPAHALSETAAGPKLSSNQPAIANLPPELAANQQYEILRELGRGGMGVVYLAKNKLMDRMEVLKVVNKTLLDHPGAVERFLREIRSAAKLSHPNVVGAYHALQMGELLAFAMEYVEGQDLASLVKSQGPLPIQHACFYVQQAALGLQHAYDKGMVHRDIKPQNLILAREGKKHIVKVLDFGLAKVMREKGEDTGLTGEGKMLGTPDYIAPEQTLDAARADIRADIYSLGCTLYYLLAGHPPFKAGSLTAVLLAHQMNEATPLNLERPDVPEELAAVVRKMMAKSPDKRYQTPKEVVQALGSAVKSGGTPKASPELSTGATEAKPAVRMAARIDPPSAPVADAPKKQPEPAAVWESLTDNHTASVSPRKSEVIRKPQVETVRKRKPQRNWLIDGGVALGLLLVALLGMWVGGVFKVKTADGILIVEVSEPNPDVFVDGEKVTVKWQNGGKKAEIRVKPGTYKIEIQKDGFRVDGRDLTFSDGDRVIFTAQLLPEKPEKPDKREEKAEVPPPEKAPPQPDTNKPDAQRVADVADDDKGFVSLFNGKDLTGWSVDLGDANQWSWASDTIIGRSANPLTRSYLLSTKEYADFTLRLEFLLERGSAGGIAIRAFEGEKLPLRDGQFTRWHPAIKLTDPAQFLDEPSGTTHWLKDDKVFCKPSENPQLRAGDWHRIEITIRGETCIAVMGGKKVVDIRAEQRGGGAIIPALNRAKGTIGFQAHQGTIHFRKIEIKELGNGKVSTTPSGLKYEELVEGMGATARQGDTAEVHYTGWLADGKKFDSSIDRKTPFSFKLGNGQVIKGWEEGVKGMKVGGKRKLTIPPELAYGKRGAGGAIPPDATLIFEIELLKIK